MGGTLSNGQVRRMAAAAGLGAGATLALAGSAQAATTFTVGTTSDTSGATDCATDASNTDCSLRDAITDANGNSGSDVIAFTSGLSGTILLGTELPKITDPVSINGPGADVITVHGNNAQRLFDVAPASPGDPVSIAGLKLLGGNPNQMGTTALNRGAAILNETADLSLAHSVISGNHATSYAGGIYSGCGTGCGAADNTGAYLANLSITDSTISGNVSGDGGGAMYLNYGSATIDNSTISGNHANWGGGVGVFYMQGPVLIENSTIAGNFADDPTNGLGGGVYIFYNPTGVTISNSTIAGNTALNGGGVNNYNETSTDPDRTQPNLNPVLDNTIVAGNTATNAGPDLFAGNASTFDSAFSLIGNISGASINETLAGSDVTGQSPLLGALASNGGPTQTMAPLAGSPAIDKGSRFGLNADQRALTRPIDLPDYKNSTAAGADGSDIGAVELQTSPGGGDVVPPAPPATHKKKCKKKKKHKRSASSAKKKCKKKKKKK